MQKGVSNPPEGYHSVKPYMIVRGGVAALDFYAKAFGAEKTHIEDVSAEEGQRRMEAEAAKAAEG